MVVTKEKNSMRLVIPEIKKNLSINFKKTIWYYLGFCLLFFVLHLAMVSLVAFFHFLLDHDIAIIEIWIHDNSWELLITSKFISFIIFMKIIQLNFASVARLRELPNKLKFIPDLKGVALVLFFSILYPALLNVFEIQLIPVADWDFSHFQFASFIGNVLFYLLDFLLILYLITNLKLTGKKNRLFLFLVISLIFLIVSDIVIPYPKAIPFLFLHILTLFLFFHRGMRNIGNGLLYCVFCIGAFAILYGVDPVWGKSYSLYLVDTGPVVPLLFLWLMGFVYYLKR